MLHSKYFEEISKRNRGVKDVRFKFATVMVFVRRVLDRMGLYSKADVEKDITCAIKEDFDEFDIIVDKSNSQVVLEAELWGVGKFDTDKSKLQLLENINTYNQDLQFGYCMLIGCKVIYQTKATIYLGADDAEDLAVAERLIRHFEVDAKAVLNREYSRRDDVLNELIQRD